MMRALLLFSTCLATCCAAVVSVDSVAATTPCEWPPSVWCSSPVIAAACQAEKACYHNVWRRQNQNDVSAKYPPVRIGLLFESLCPGCRNFIQTHLYKAYRELKSIANFTLIPFGNAHEAWNETTHRWDFKCQHGKRECIGNLIETCGIRLYSDDPDKYMAFVYCIESSDGFPDQMYKRCAKVAKVDADKIHKCYTSKTGNTYEHDMAKSTPDHKYVPWVILNGVHSDEIQAQAEQDLVKLICDTYVGPKPAACREKTSKHGSVNNWV